jgi:hypothetical protein
MQSTGQTATHEASFVPMHGSVITYGTDVSFLTYTSTTDATGTMVVWFQTTTDELIRLPLLYHFTTTLWFDAQGTFRVVTDQPWRTAGDLTNGSTPTEINLYSCIMTGLAIISGQCCCFGDRLLRRIIGANNDMGTVNLASV